MALVHNERWAEGWQGAWAAPHALRASEVYAAPPHARARSPYGAQEMIRRPLNKFNWCFYAFIEKKMKESWGLGNSPGPMFFLFDRRIPFRHPQKLARKEP